MRTKLIPIGNSKGIRLPKAVIDQYGLHDQIEMDLADNAVVLRPVRAARAGWEEAFVRMHKRGDDRLSAGSESGTSFDRKEWTW